MEDTSIPPSTLGQPRLIVCVVDTNLASKACQARRQGSSSDIPTDVTIRRSHLPQPLCLLPFRLPLPSRSQTQTMSIPSCTPSLAMPKHKRWTHDEDRLDACKITFQYYAEDSSQYDAKRDGIRSNDWSQRTDPRRNQSAGTTRRTLYNSRP
jgi:hypothetical protein